MLVGVCFSKKSILFRLCVIEAAKVIFDKKFNSSFLKKTILNAVNILDSENVRLRLEFDKSTSSLSFW